MRHLAKAIPADVGTIHFIAIGGIGMSAIAEILHDLGYTVQGSDAQASANTARLQQRGLKVFIGHAAAQVNGAAVVVVSSAIGPDNPELQAAYQLGLPVVHRAEMLAELTRFQHTIAVAGSHGKTTTTAMIFTLLAAGGIDPAIVNGGILPALGSNAHLGQGSWMVVEADESDGSFRHFWPRLAVVTNIDHEHHDHFPTLAELDDAFYDFCQQVPFYGRVIACADHPGTQRLVARLGNKTVITYGLTDGADLQAVALVPDTTGTTFNLRWPDGGVQTAVRLNVVGTHNVLNALAALAAATAAGVRRDQACEALATFTHVKRRFNVLGAHRATAFIEDYAHHPAEIAATLQAATQAFGQAPAVVFQPHRYSRLAALLPEFADSLTAAAAVAILPVYSAGEAPRAGVDHIALAQLTPGAEPLNDTAALAAWVERQCGQARAILFLGAGSIGQHAQQQLARLTAVANG